MKATLTIEVEFDPKVTDAESLATAADRLLETTLSMPGIMDEYANPRFGEFFVATGMEKPEAERRSNSAAPHTKPVQSKPKPTSTAMKRYFEFVDGTSLKFWEIAQDGSEVTVRFGRIGTNGQTQTKSLADADAATKHVEKHIKEKSAKGYQETVAR